MLDEWRERYIGQHGIIKLTEHETLFLKCLLDNWKYKCATYEEIGKYIWGNLISINKVRNNTRIIAMNLNKKLKNEFYISAIRGRGYIIR